MKTDLPNQCYGLFVDAVSLLDFFSCIGHVDADKTFAAFHSQQKTGFTLMYKARIAASIQNVFPMVFGRTSSSGMDDSEYIPAIQDPMKWDNGVTGIKHQITRGMSDVEYQLESAIDMVLGPYGEARQIAKECLFKSKRFVTDLCHFISNDYQKWKLRGHGQKDAWQMTAVSVRRIFEEIHSERVIARDIYDYKDLTFSTSKFLWATWKAHQVMDRYIKHQFYEHPSIPAVLAHHLADNYVKPDDALANKVHSADKAHQALVSRVDTLTTRLNALASVKEKDEKPPTPKQQSKNDKARVTFASYARMPSLRLPPRPWWFMGTFSLLPPLLLCRALCMLIPPHHGLAGCLYVLPWLWTVRRSFIPLHWVSGLNMPAFSSRPFRGSVLRRHCRLRVFWSASHHGRV